MRTLASSATRSLRCAIALAVQLLAGSIYRSDDLILGRLRATRMTRCLDSQATELSSLLLPPQSLEEGIVLDAYDCHEGLALLFYDDRLTRIADPVSEFREARPRLACGYVSLCQIDILVVYSMYILYAHYSDNGWFRGSLRLPSPGCLLER